MCLHLKILTVQTKCFVPFLSMITMYIDSHPLKFLSKSDPFSEILYLPIHSIAIATRLILAICQNFSTNYIHNLFLCHLLIQLQCTHAMDHNNQLISQILHNHLLLNKYVLMLHLLMVHKYTYIQLYIYNSIWLAI